MKTKLALSAFVVALALAACAKKEEAAPPPPPSPSEVYLKEIRDLLAKR